jgi:SAM-dependent methyltransferase
VTSRLRRSAQDNLCCAGLDLPDVGRLLTIPEPVLRRLGQRLRAIGLAPPFLRRLARVGERVDDALRAPMRVWNARRMREPAATAARLFMLYDVVSPDEVRTALGELAPLSEGGLIEETSDGIRSRIHLALAADVYCFGDQTGSHEDTVLPLCGATLDLVRASIPDRRIDAALDVGCGAGALGLILARVADRVVATDANARAIAFARFNAALNGVRNIDLREGDLLESVRGERYALLAAQPPFIARREGAPTSTFVHGTRGDEVALRLIAEAPSLLATGGRALILADWPLMAGDGLDVRVRTALGEARVDALVVQSPSKNLDEYCVLHAALEHPNLGDAFARAAMAQREHLDRLAIQGVALALVVLESAQGAEWTSLATIRHWSDATITAQVVDRLMAAHRLAHAGGEAVAAARLRLPEGAMPIDQPMPNGAPPAVVIQLPPGRPEWPVVFDARSAAILSRIAEAPSVLDAARAAARDERVALETLLARIESVARDALLRGALDIA